MPYQCMCGVDQPEASTMVEAIDACPACKPILDRERAALAADEAKVPRRRRIRR